jgi:DNA repair exonuclease SbcCD ATPase subunit
MNDIEFITLTIRNFLSVGNQPIIITFNTGLNFVVGLNKQTGSPNGVGKTVIFFDAIFYALFGIAVREASINNLINNRNNKNMFVELALIKNGKPLLIHRGRKPNVFYYEYDGVKYQSNETQENLNKLLDISKDIFTNIFLINASEILDFLKEEGSVKLKERFEKIFFRDLIFKKLLEVFRREYNSFSKIAESNKNKIHEKIEVMKKLKLFFQDQKKLIEAENDIKKKEELILDYKNKLNEISLISLDEKKKDLLGVKKDQILSEINTLESEVFSGQKTIKEIEKLVHMLDGDHSNCPVCQQALTAEVLKEVKDNYVRKIKEITFKITEHREKENKFSSLAEKVKSALHKMEAEQKDREYKKFTFEKEVISLNKELEHIRNNFSDQTKIKKELMDLKDEVLALKQNEESYAIELADLELITTLFDNNAGIMNFFITKIISQLNLIIKKFTNQLNLEYQFYFTGDLKLKFDVYDSISLGNLSSGEKKLVNFVVLFSLQAFFIEQLNFKPSIIVIDEILDTSVAAISMEKVFKIINTFHKDNNIGVYLLSHDEKGIHNSVIEFDHVIRLEKIDGFTSIIDEMNK